MINIPNMLLIGATDRNVGKTTFACDIIKKFSANAPVVALKITVIKKNNGMCPRGGEGCGVCSSVSGNFMITEELNTDSQKDTSQMLAAGSKKVFWLRVMEQHMQEGVKTLLDNIKKTVGLNLAIICESNSIRKVIEPGLFVVFKKKDDNYIKPSCHDVIEFADKIINKDMLTHKFSGDLNRFSFNDIKWSYKENVTGIILAGGKSLRFGMDKSMLSVNGKSMIEHIAGQLKPNFSQILLGANEVQKFSFLGCKVVPDKNKGCGPLMGILSCLESSKTELNFVVGCDIPNIDMLLVRKMLRESEDYDAVVPTTDDNLIEPLFAVYRKSVINHIKDILYNSKKRRIKALFDCVNTKYLKMGKAGWYRNINTKDDYNEFINVLKKEDLKSGNSRNI
jgi:molybdopterin-guanine dinucleotide biosynthesis protein A